MTILSGINHGTSREPKFYMGAEINFKFCYIPETNETSQELIFFTPLLLLMLWKHDAFDD